MISKKEVSLGARILITLTFTLIMIGAVDVFLAWYKSFLQKRKIEPNLIRLLTRLTFILLAFLFWRAFVGQTETFELNITHFLFACFIYCFYRLITTFFKEKDS